MKRKKSPGELFYAGSTKVNGGDKGYETKNDKVNVVPDSHSMRAPKQIRAKMQPAKIAAGVPSPRKMIYVPPSIARENKNTPAKYLITPMLSP